MTCHAFINVNDIKETPGSPPVNITELFEYATRFNLHDLVNDAIVAGSIDIDNNVTVTALVEQVTKPLYLAQGDLLVLVPD